MIARFLFSCFLSNSPLLSRKRTPKLFTLFIHKVPRGVFYAPTLFIPHVAWGTWSVGLAPPSTNRHPQRPKGKWNSIQAGILFRQKRKKCVPPIGFAMPNMGQDSSLDLYISGFCVDKEKVFPLEALGKHFFGLLVHLFYAFQCDDGHLLIRFPLTQVWAFCV